MVMIPKTTTDNLTADFEIQSQPSKTYKMNIDEETITAKTDDLRAIQQAIYKILNTERYQYVIYSWNYGIELADLFGEPLPYVYPELKRRITEALLADDRISAVDNFTFSHKRGEVSTTFEVTTVSGVITATKVVKI